MGEIFLESHRNEGEQVFGFGRISSVSHCLVARHTAYLRTLSRTLSRYVRAYPLVYMVDGFVTLLRSDACVMRSHSSCVCVCHVCVVIVCVSSQFRNRTVI